jgi:hypothetical protein
MRRVRIGVTTVVVSAGLIAPAAAHAQGASAPGTPTDAQYGSAGSAGGAGGIAPSGGGSLPFTGLDIGVLAVVGAGMLGSGALLWRRGRTASEE